MVDVPRRAVEARGITRRWLRLNHAKRLLAETDTKHHQIANESGFSSESRLSVVFRRETGMTPGEFRSRFNPEFGQHRKKIGRPGGS